MNLFSFIIHIGYGENRIDFDETDPLGTKLQPKEIHVHPKYAGNPYFDIAIISTEPLKFNTTLLAVCLPEVPDPNPDSYLNNHMSLIGNFKLTSLPSVSHLVISKLTMVNLF